MIEDVINDVRDIFLDDGVDEQVLMELKTLWENKLMQSRAVDGFHSDEQQLLLQVQQQHQPQQQQHHHHHHSQGQPQQTVTQQAQTQQVLIPASQQATAPQVIVPDSKLIQHMNASNMSAAATAATLALPAGVTPVQQILTNSGQLLQVVRAANSSHRPNPLNNKLHWSYKLMEPVIRHLKKMKMKRKTMMMMKRKTKRKMELKMGR